MAARATQEPGSGRLLVGACGAAAVTMLPSYLVSIATEVGCPTTVLMTAAAEQFLPTRTVALFAGDTVNCEVDASFARNHVQLAAEADLILVLPATAHILAAVAGGHALGNLALTILAAQCPVIFAPSMNRVMWSKPAVQRNISQLRDDGYEIIEPDWSARFELSTRQMMANPSLPSPKHVSSVVYQHLITNVSLPGTLYERRLATLRPVLRDGGDYKLAIRS